MCIRMRPENPRFHGIGICCRRMSQQLCARHTLDSRVVEPFGACVAGSRLKTRMQWSSPLLDSSWGDMKIENVQQLEERISRPTEADVQAMSQLQGDVLILGVGGKMGPTLAQLIQRSAIAAGKNTRVIGVSRFSNRAMPAALKSHGIEAIECDL